MTSNIERITFAAVETLIRNHLQITSPDITDIKICGIDFLHNHTISIQIRRPLRPGEPNWEDEVKKLSETLQQSTTEVSQ